MVSSQICTCKHLVDQSLRQTLSTFWSLTFRSRVSTNHIVTWEIQHNNADWTVSRLWLCRRSWRFEIDFRLNIMRILKPHVCSNKLDVQETDMCVKQFKGIGNYFSGCRFAHGRNSRAWSQGLVVDVMHSNSNQKQKVKQARGNPLHGKVSEKRVNIRCNTQVPQRHLDLSNVDIVSSNVNSSRKGAMLYIFEDNEAVIKMIKSRSPTLRHVSRTHRVALDWLFGRIIADLKIQIRYVDSNNQLADIFTNRHFTCDEWNHLLCLFNIILFSSQSCSEAMAKRPQEGDYEEKGRCQNKTGEKFGIEKPCRDLNSAIFDGIFQPRDVRTWRSRSEFKSKYGATRSSKLQKKISLKVIQWRILKCGIQMQVRWLARWHP